MEFNINGKTKELKFGIGFIRKLDAKYTGEMEGIKFGMGMMMATVQLRQYNPAALSDVIHCAMKGSPKVNDVDEVIEAYADEHDGLGDLFEEVLSEMGKSNVIKDTQERLQNLSNAKDNEN